MGCLGGGWLAGSLAERRDAHQHGPARAHHPDTVAVDRAADAHELKTKRSSPSWVRRPRGPPAPSGRRCHRSASRSTSASSPALQCFQSPMGKRSASEACCHFRCQNGGMRLLRSYSRDDVGPRGSLVSSRSCSYSRTCASADQSLHGLASVGSVGGSHARRSRRPRPARGGRRRRTPTMIHDYPRLVCPRGQITAFDPSA
jgi:hypothetical protein